MCGLVTGTRPRQLEVKKFSSRSLTLSIPLSLAALFLERRRAPCSASPRHFPHMGIAFLAWSAAAAVAGVVLSLVGGERELREREAPLQFFNLLAQATHPSSPFMQAPPPSPPVPASAWKPT